ncbi:MAG: hypothetical protein Q8R05_07535, partial [Candidatus Omnitrophota bacterium]|nr:hypothetical protein [Candidatus Omnitrophota bacterium]
MDIISGYNAALALNPASGYSLTGSVTKNAATGNEVAYDLAATINKATSGNYTGLKLNVTETLAPGADDRLLDFQVAGTSMFRVDNAGNVTAAGTITGTGSALSGTTSDTFEIDTDDSSTTPTLTFGANVAAVPHILTQVGNLHVEPAGAVIINDGTIGTAPAYATAAGELFVENNFETTADAFFFEDISIKTGKSIVVLDGTNNQDFNHSIVLDQAANVMYFKEWTTFTWTNTSPVPDVDIMTLTPTTGLNVLNDDASNTTVTDILTLRHSSTAVPAAGIGTGLSFQVEDAGGLEEQASIDTVLTTVTEAAENADMVFKVNQAGTISELMKLDAANDRVTVSGGLNVTGTFTPATIGAFTAGGTIDMNTNIITNIGNAGTDFVAATGALNLADDLTLAAGADLTMSSGAGLYSQTYTGTATPMTLTANSMTTGSGISVSANGLSTGNGISISSTSTAADAYKLVNLSSSGAAAALKDRYGIYSSMTGTGTGVNYAGYFTASGASTNRAIYATGDPTADAAVLESVNSGNDGTAGTFVATATGVGSNAKGIYVRNDGRGDVAAHIENNNTLATAQTLYITSNSTQSPDVVSIAPTGNMAGGNGLVITNTSTTNDARGMYLRNDGDGAVGAHLEINNTANASQVIYCITNGTGYDASFIRNNTSTSSDDTAIEVKHTASASGGADGIGANIVFNNETSTNGTEHATAKISGVLTDADTVTTTDGDLVFSYAQQNTFKEGIRLVSGGNLQFEGSTDDGFETTFSITEPTADRTITIPNADVNLGTISTNSHAQNTDTGTSGTDFKIGNASDASAVNLSLTFGNTAPETITFTGAGTDNFAFSDAIEAEGMTLTGALAANAGITFDNATDTVGAFTSAGTINMNTNIIENIGNTGTDFIVTTGALNLAGTLTLAANANLTMSSGTGVYSQTYTSTATPMTLTADSMTTGNGISISADALSSGYGISVDSTSTALAGRLLSLTASGAAAATTRYGVYSSLTGAGLTSTNIAGYFNAQNGTTANYALIAENGSVGIGDTTPDAALDIDSAAAATVDSFGIIHTSTTDGADAEQIAITQSVGTLATATNAGINISTTSSSITASTLLGINIANITAGTATENAIRIGTGWDRGINFLDEAVAKIDFGSNSAKAKWMGIDSSWYHSFTNDTGFRFYISADQTGWGTQKMQIDTDSIDAGVDIIVGTVATNRWIKMFGNILFEENDDYIGTYNAGTITLGNVNNTTTATTINIGRPSSTADIAVFNVGYKVPVVAKTAAYTATTSDMVITGDGTAAAFSITLPAASGNTGRSYTIKKIDSSVNAVTVDPNLAETIDGAATYALSAQWK